MKPTVRICVPCPNHNTITKECLDSLEEIKTMTSELTIDIVRIIGTAISHQRCEGVHFQTSNLVYQTDNYNEEFDYYLALDADISFKPTDLRHLIALNLDIVGGAYHARESHKQRYVAGDFEPGYKYASTDFFLSSQCRGLIKVDWIGMGFTLIKRDVFRKIRYPWWREVVVEVIDPRDGKLHAHYNGDDIGFCLNAKEAGYDIYCDCDVVVKHHVDE